MIDGSPEAAAAAADWPVAAAVSGERGDSGSAGDGLGTAEPEKGDSVRLSGRGDGAPDHSV